MSGKRRVYMSKVNTSGGYLAKIGRENNGWRSEFIYDKRSKSVRLFKDRSIVLSNQQGKGSKRDYYAVFRKFKGTKDQQITISNSNFVKNRAGHCLTPSFFKNEDKQPMVWHKCHHLNSQKFTKEFATRSHTTYKQKFARLRNRVKASSAFAQQMAKPSSSHA